MRALVLDAPRTPLRMTDLPDPVPTPGQLLLRVRACGVCRTDLHVVDGDLTRPKLPLVLGHQIVGEVVDGGDHRFALEARVGVPWLGWTCGECRFCLAGAENLCDRARFTGYDLDGGYAELTVADERYCFPIPDGYADEQAAPLLCAGLIGFRSLRLAGDAERIGLIWKCVDDAVFPAEVAALAARLAALPTRALVATRQALDASQHLDLAAALSFEADVQRTLGAAHDFQEGVAAFMAKRAPVFGDR